MSSAATLDALARLFGEALSPLAARLQGDQVEGTIEQLGLRLPGGSLTAGALPQALQASAAACAQLPAAVAALIAAIEGNDDDALIAASVALGRQIIEAVAAFTKLGIAIDNVVQAAAGLTPAQRTRLGEAAREIPERLLHLALVSYLEDEQPNIKHSLTLAGLLDDSAVAGDPADPSLPPFRLKRVRFDRIGTLFSDPAKHLKDVYGFGTPGFDGLELFRRVKQMVDRPEGEALIITVPGRPNVLEALAFRLAVEPGPAPGTVPGLRVRIRMPAEKDVSVAVPIGGPWSVTIDSSARFSSGIEFALHPVTGLHIEPPVAAASVAFALGLRAANSDGTPMILIGQAGASRLELLSASARLPLQLSASTGAPSPAVKFGAAVELEQGKLVIDASQADGFIGTLLGGVKVESAFDLSALYDTDAGLRFTGSATIEIALPTHLTLGPVSIPNVYLIGGFRDGQIPVEFSVDLVAQLGPLSAAVNRLGALASITFPEGGGNAGAAQIDVSFKPPNGVGLSVDAGVVKGGGFLFIDTERGEYAGALELTLAGFISLKALGIINTRMPDGSSGFSLLIIISVEFGAGLQLGFGFTLLGVGGLLGLNRTMRLDALAEGVRSGGLNSILFPRDIVANATQIISDLRAFFPPQNGVFLIGPMLKLGWGTPTLVSLTIGIIIEIPGNIAIVGVLRVALPAEEAAVVVLQVSFIGAIEFDKSRGWFFASLFDSRVLFITISGEMGLLIAFGNDANFVVSVGGFHPRYAPPALPFPSPRRIALDILNTDFARIRAEGYFAVTSNSVQFGCRAEAFFGFDVLNVSGHFQLDALIRFSPFYFIIGFSSHFEVKVFGIGVWGLRIRLEVEGPTPWRARGSAGISLLFFDIDVDIDVTWGDADQTTLEPILVMRKLVEELSKDDSWRALPPPGASLLVSVRKLPEDENKIAFHPLGTLQISQRFVPLNAKLDRVGAQRPGDGKRFSVAAASPVFAKRGDVQEKFAPAQFEDLSDDQRLSRKAFEDRNGGVELSAAGAQIESGAAIVRVARYELFTIDTNGRRHRYRFALQGALLFRHLLNGAAIARSALSASNRNAIAPVKNGVKSRPEGFAVALQENNKVAGAHTIFASEGAARDWMADAVASDRSLTDKFHVVPEFEVVS